jgi:spore maturation protein CgeB
MSSDHPAGQFERPGMRICLIGKIGSVTHWLEDCAAGLVAAGHVVQICPTRNPKLSATLERLLLAHALGAPRAASTVKAIRKFIPDLILAVKGFDMPSEILDRLRSLPDRPPLAAWVGDSFFETDRPIAEQYDIVAYTDSSFVKQHQSMAFTSRCLYLPHAANTRLGEPNATARAPRLVFVANPTPHRVNLLSRVQMPIDLCGPGWQPFPQATHDIHRGQLDVLALSAAYRSHIGVLNIRHETNTVHGLNQRSFDPYLLGTPVVSDDQPDLKNCFEEGREVLVYRDTDELEDIYRRLRKEPKLGLDIGATGRRRVISEHCYNHRIDKLTAALF